LNTVLCLAGSPSLTSTLHYLVFPLSPCLIFFFVQFEPSRPALNLCPYRDLVYQPLPLGSFGYMTSGIPLWYSSSGSPYSRGPVPPRIAPYITVLVCSNYLPTFRSTFTVAFVFEFHSCSCPRFEHSIHRLFIHMPSDSIMQHASDCLRPARVRSRAQVYYALYTQLLYFMLPAFRGRMLHPGSFDYVVL